MPQTEKGSKTVVLKGFEKDSFILNYTFNHPKSFLASIHLCYSYTLGLQSFAPASLIHFLIESGPMATTGQSSRPNHTPGVKRLVLCFDGTGNSYTGTSLDTNVIKLYKKLDKTHSDQYHYYQRLISVFSLSKLC